MPIALLLYYATPNRFRSVTLTLLSYVFYGWWNPWFTLLMAASTVLDFACGKMIAADGATPNQRKAGVTISVLANLAVLAFFKYSAFAAANVSALSEWFGLGPVAPPEFLLRIVLPVGISFYTFQSMSYSIDLYRGHARPAKNLIDFACYVSMFPQLVAGPIVRYGSVAEQLHSREHRLDVFISGFTRFNYGLAKKVLLANNVGSIADACFASGDGALSVTMAWIGIVAYAFQIYFDFSGYSDMAIGLGKMFGFHFPENFNSPYRSTSITDFWRRWHISLSSFLRDYLYIPLGGNRKGEARTYINLLLVMLIGGLWHGAQWTFVIWGAIHGLMLAAERFAGRRSLPIPKLLKVAFTFGVVLITWVFFRAENLEVALGYLSSMFGLSELAPAASLLKESLLTPFHLFALALAASVVWLAPRTARLLEVITLWKVLLGLGLLIVSIRQLFYQGFNPFLYFQF
ncbi:MAG: MBOAT family protein [Verrucomicrobiota bacterium]